MRPFEYAAVIPAHNEAGYIARAVLSTQRQSLPPRQVVVVDDGSTDGTRQVASALPGVTVIHHDSCTGLASARNTGYRASSCPWVAFLDADDEWHPGKTERQAGIVEACGAGLVYCGVLLREEGKDRSTNIPAARFRSQRALRRTLLLRNCITGSGSAVLVRRDLLDQVGGFDENLRRSEDRDMWIRLSWLTTFAAAREPLVSIWQRSASLGADPERMYEAGRAVIEKNRKLYQYFWDGTMLWRRAQAGLYERRGMTLLSNGDHARAKRDFAQAALRWPFRLKTLVPLAKLCLGLSGPGRVR